MTRRLAWPLVVLLLAPVPVMAQGASPSTDTQLEMARRHRRVVVRPSTPPAVVELDAETVAVEVGQRRRHEDAVREATGPAPRRRPDLDYDVKSGIQSRRLNDALGRR